MVITNFNDIKDELAELTKEPRYQEVPIDLPSGTHIIRVLQYLPTEGKTNLIQYVVDKSIDSMTGCFSPLRVNVYFAIGLIRSYCGIHFDEDMRVDEAYDMLESLGIVDKIIESIPIEEREYIETLINDTIKDIARYNNSFAGIMAVMSLDSQELDTSIKDILENVKNKEGLEVLAEIKNVVGTD